MLDAWQPDHVEASSPWSSATMVGRWQGLGDALAGHAFGSAGGLCLSLARRHRARSPPSTAGSAGSGGICAASASCSTPSCAPTIIFTERLARRRHSPRGNGADGRRAGAFSPSLRSPELRAAALARWGLDPDAILLSALAASRPKTLGHGDPRRGSSRSAGAGRLAPRRRRRGATQARDLLAERFATSR